MFCNMPIRCNISYLATYRTMQHTMQHTVEPSICECADETLDAVSCGPASDAVCAPFFFCSRSHSLYADGTFEPPSTCTATADPCFGMRNALIGSSSLKSAAVFRALSAELDVAVICRRVVPSELGMFIGCDVLRILARGFALAYSDKSSRSTDCHGQASVTPMPNESP